jgi:hypothetical protein
MLAGMVMSLSEEVLHCFPQSVQANARIVPDLAVTASF